LERSILQQVAVRGVNNRLMATLDTTNFTRRPAPRSPFAALASAALPGWDISLVFVGTTRAKSLNIRLRNKDYVPNVLSYESGEKSGEIIICLEVAKKQAPSYDMTYQEFVSYLFIHGLMHLKGYPHGPTMEQRERALMARHLDVHLSNEKTTHRNRNRHRHTPHESRGSRGGGR